MYWWRTVVGIVFKTYEPWESGTLCTVKDYDVLPLCHDAEDY